MNKQKKPQRIALIETLLVFILLAASCALFLFWASKSKDSPLAESIRKMVGISDPRPSKVVLAPAPAPLPESTPAVKSLPVPEPELVASVGSASIPEITFAEIATRQALWPDSLTLKLAVQVAIRYNGKDYGYMEFPKGRSVKVDALLPSGEIFCVIDGNYLSLSVYETDFYGWFKDTHGESYDIQPVVVDFGKRSTERYKLDTPQGEAAFWAEMRIWCHQNYESVSLEVGEDGLVFKWLPKEDAPIDFSGEAREIARQYLLKRAKYGGRDNYAACEIREPVTGELLGASSIFIPRL